MKKKILFLLILLNCFLSFATGLKNVYWDMPYNKLLIEKPVVENSMKLGGITYEILEERSQKENIYYIFLFKKLNMIIIDTTKPQKYIKEKKCVDLIYDDTSYEADYLIENTPQKYNCAHHIKKYLLMVDECYDYLGECSSYINQMKEKNIKESKIKISIYQSTENTKAFVFENIIKDETFMVLLPE